MSDFKDKVFRDYKIIKLIGQGKFSYVFQAQNLKTGKQIALKLLKIFDMNDTKQRDNCIKEVKLMEKLKHQHITHYIESFILDNEMFIAVEWCSNGDLKELIKKRRKDGELIPERVIWNYIL